jgi:type I restriction enzyme S subunit
VTATKSGTWETAAVKDLAKYITVGFVGSMSPLFVDSGVPLLRGQNILPCSLDMTNLKYISKETHRNWKKSALQAGDVVMVRVGYPGTACVIPEGLGDINAASLVIVRPNPDLLDSHFLCYVLNSPWGKAQIKNRLVGAAQQVLNTRTAAELEIPAPPLLTQRKIAAILSLVYNSIEKSDEVITQTQRLKKGLMQQLFTRGIGHTKFKQTELGEIPKNWKVHTLEAACTDITDGSHWSPKGNMHSDYRIATVANLEDNYIDINSCKTVSNIDYARLSREGDVPRDGDILLSKDGTVGISLSFKQSKDNIAVLSSIAIIRPNPQILDSEFGAQVLKSPRVRSLMLGKKTGSALRRIILGDIRKVIIPVPPLAEQQKIASILSTVDDSIHKSYQTNAKTQQLKKGLTNDLLTGKVKVKVT